MTGGKSPQGYFISVTLLMAEIRDKVLLTVHFLMILDFGNSLTTGDLSDE